MSFSAKLKKKKIVLIFCYYCLHFWILWPLLNADFRLVLWCMVTYHSYCTDFLPSEIHEALNPGESPTDRPDPCIRVFELNMMAMLEDVLKNQVLGRVKAYFGMKEYQKRGLPVSVAVWCNFLLQLLSLNIL
jgi:hypothetical protein